MTLDPTAVKTALAQAGAGVDALVVQAGVESKAAVAAAVATTQAADHATLAIVQKKLDDALAEIAILQHQPPPPGPTTGRFPADPGIGKVIFGCATTGGNVARVQLHEQAAGVPLAGRRRYLNAGASDLGGATSPFGKLVLEDHAAHRVPVPSVKPGTFADTAAGKFDAQLTALTKWVETLPRPVVLIVNHEPENDAWPAADYRAAQKHIRQVIDAAAGGTRKRLAFAGSLMTYTWTPASGRHPDDWYPGPGVWDFVAGDHYAPKTGVSQLIDGVKYAGFIAWCKAHNLIPAFTELGVHNSDPTCAAQLKSFYARAIADGAVMILDYDDNGGPQSSPEGWELNDTHGQLTAFHDLMRDPRSVNPAA